MKTIAEKVEDVEHFRQNLNPNEKQSENLDVEHFRQNQKLKQGKKNQKK